MKELHGEVMTETQASLLIVEDSAYFRQVLRLMLGYGIYRFHEAENAQQAMQVVNMMRPDVALVDIGLPGDMDGIDVCRFIKRESEARNCRVIMVSGKDDQGIRERVQAAGADDFVVKPFKTESLIEAVESRGHVSNLHKGALG